MAFGLIFLSLLLSTIRFMHSTCTNEKQVTKGMCISVSSNPFFTAPCHASLSLRSSQLAQLSHSSASANQLSQSRGNSPPLHHTSRPFLPPINSPVPFVPAATALSPPPTNTSHLHHTAHYYDLPTSPTYQGRPSFTFEASLPTPLA